MMMGAIDLAKPLTLTEIFQSHLSNSETKSKEKESEEQQNAQDSGVRLERKFDNSHCSDVQGARTEWREAEESKKSCNFNGNKSSFVCPGTQVDKIGFMLYAGALCSAGGGEPKAPRWAV